MSLIKPMIWMHMTLIVMNNITKITLMANLSHYGSDVLAEKAQQLEPKLYDGNVIKNSCAIVIPDSEETLRLAKERVKLSTSASESQPSGNTKKDKIRQPPSSTQKNKVEAHPRTAKSNLKNKNYDVEPKGTGIMQHSKLNANYELICVKCNSYMLSHNHELYVLNVINDVNARSKSKSVKKTSKRKVWKPTGKVFTKIRYTWRPTGRTFTIVGNMYPLTRITIAAEVPFRKPTALETDTPKPVATLVYSRQPRKSKTSVPVSKPKIIKSISANNREPNKPWGSIVSDVPRSSLDEYSLEPALHEMTPATISSGLVPNPPPLTPFVPPLKTNWDILFQPLFDELVTPLPSFDLPAPEVIASIAEVVALEPTASTGLPSSTTIDQDAPSLSNSQTSPETQSLVLFHFIIEQVKNGVVELYFVNTEYQLADIFTKALGRERIEFLISKLGMQSFTPETLIQLADEAEE
nr:ribonuclease H [Tanacetum cinerariifolium]